MDLTLDHKTEVERKIIKEEIKALDNGELTDEQLPDIADFVLERIDQVNNHEQLIAFLGELSSRWPFFKTLEELERNEIAEVKENKIEEEVLKLAKSGKVSEAINLAKTVMEK